MATERRFSVSADPQAARALDRLQARTGRSQSDLVNRAVTAYEQLERLSAEGADVVVRHGGLETRLMFL